MWVLQQQCPDEPQFILSDDNRLIARFTEATDSERALAIAAPRLLAALEKFIAEREEQVVALGWGSAAAYHKACQNDEAYALAKAAIAEAKGGAQ